MLVSESRKPQTSMVLIHECSQESFHCCLHKEWKIKPTRPAGPVWKPRWTSEFPAWRRLQGRAHGAPAHGGSRDGYRVACVRHTNTEQAAHDVPGHMCPRTRWRSAPRPRRVRETGMEWCLCSRNAEYRSASQGHHFQITPKGNSWKQL